MGDGKALAHGYQSLKHWNEWLTEQFLGERLLTAEGFQLTQLLNKHYGKQALLIGVPKQYPLLLSSPILYHSLLTPLAFEERKPHHIQADIHEIPILTGSIDLVMLPHTLELVTNPQKLLAEACRITKPEGLIVICGFNPYSSWALKKVFTYGKKNTWRNHFIHSRQIQHWLKLADFVLEKRMSALFTPPITHPNIYNKFNFLEKVGNRLFPFLGGVYIMLARAKVVPLTPIRLQWKQQLNGIRLPATLPGPVANQSK